MCSNSRQNIHKVVFKDVYYENYIATSKQIGCTWCHRFEIETTLCLKKKRPTWLMTVTSELLTTQGCAATYLTCDGFGYMGFVGKLTDFPAVEEFSKSVKIWLVRWDVIWDTMWTAG